MAIAPVGSGGSLNPGVAAAAEKASGPQLGKAPFASVVENLLHEANGQQIQADQAVRELAMGRADNLHDVMLSVAKADLSFRMVLEVRNRLTEAYQDIMRMQL